MKKNLTLLFFIFVYHLSSSQVWVKKAAVYTGTGGRANTSFAIPSLGAGYCVGGSPFSYETWKYDTLSGSWSQCQNYPGGADGTQVGFSINDTGYVGVGVSWGCGIYNTFYKYDPFANMWSPLPNVPGPPRGYAVGFAVGGKGYIGGGTIGCNLGGLNDFYSYDPTTNKWDTIAPCPEKGCNLLAVGFSIGNYGYVGIGDTLNAGGSGTPVNDFYQYDPTSNKWTKKADVPGGPRVAAVGFATCSMGYIGLGQTGPNQNIYTREFYRYDPVKDTWKQSSNFGGVSRAVSPSFVIGNSCFVCLGYDSTSSNSTLYDLWEYIPSYTPAFSADSSVCAGSSITFTDTSDYNPDSWLWSFPGGTPSTSNAQTVNIVYNNIGTYDVTLTAFNGCDSATKTFSKYVTVNPGAALTIVPASASVCSGTPVTLTVSGGNKITWNPGSTLSKTTGDTVIANPSLTTTYTASDSSGSCISTQQVVVTIVPSDTAGKITAARDTICQGTKGVLTLAGNNSNVIQWQSSLTPGNFKDTLAVDTVNYSTLPLNQSTYFRVKVGTGSCLSVSDSIFLFVPPALIANFGYTFSGSTVSFSDSSLGNIISYSWAFGDGTNSQQKNPSHPYPKADTTYNACLTVYDGSNCSYTFCKAVSLFTGIASVPGTGTFQLYPNPVSKQLAVSGLQLAGSEIDIIDILGRMLLAQKATDNQATIDVSNLSSGIYLIEIRSNDGLAVKKFVKE